MEKLNKLIEYALVSGADQVAAISVKDIVIDETLADKCRECPNYGLAKSCPPLVTGPSVIKKVLENFQQAIVFTVDVASEDLFSDKRRQIFRQLHNLAAGIEQAALEMGFSRARAYAGGSCKEIFCHSYPDCPALSDKNQCRYLQHARPSMSGFGIDVARLFASAGWEMIVADPAESKIASVCGLVLIF